MGEHNKKTETFPDYLGCLRQPVNYEKDLGRFSEQNLKDVTLMRPYNANFVQLWVMLAHKSSPLTYGNVTPNLDTVSLVGLCL